MSYRRPVGSNSPYGGHSNNAGNGGYGGYSGGGENALMSQNDDHVDQLSAKMSVLKEISLQIGDEVNYQNKMLNDMEGDFDKTGDILGNTIKRLGQIAKSPNGFWMCWLMAFVVLVLFYIIFSRFF
ncbi:hypothetical protein BDR26DRAFT_862269 [Obelidium mucronatum]|nr:hypothetical protein BDR26DRAFT_862269 [Obelidium mucronatum]